MSKKEKEFVLPKGIDQELYDSAKDIVVSGFEANQDADAIKSALFGEGIPFSKLAKLFNAITKNENLVIDMKNVKEKIAEIVKETEFTFEESYDDLIAFSNKVIEGVKGATKAKVFSAVKAKFLENETKMPRKVAPKRGRMGSINKTLINVFAKNKEATEADCIEALKDVAKSPENYAKSYHKLLYAVANGLTALEVLTKFSDEK